MTGTRGVSEAQAGALVVLALGLATLLSFQPLSLHSEPAAEPELGSGPRPIDRAAVSVLNLNAADAAVLMRLPGVGPVIARRIVEHRRRHGAFARIADLLAVSGIGPAKLAKLSPHIRLGEKESSEEVEPVTGMDSDGEHERLEVAR